MCYILNVTEFIRENVLHDIFYKGERTDEFGNPKCRPAIY